MAGGWSTSKKFRWKLRELNKAAGKAEKRWKATIDARVKVYSLAELEKFAAARGMQVSKNADSSKAVRRPTRMISTLRRSQWNRYHSTMTTPKVE